MQKVTIKDLRDAPRLGKQYTEVRTSRLDEATACAEAGVEIIMCMKEDLPVIRPAVPDVFVISANELTQPHIASADQNIAAGFELMNMGADAVYSGMSYRVVEAMAKEHIPVIGHIGFVPYRSTWFGGTRAVGKKADEAYAVYEAAKAYQDAGALGVEIEIVPTELMEVLADRLDLVFISMGSGSKGSAVQYLFATDVLGTNTGHIPRHAKVYGNLGEEEARLHTLRVEAFKALQGDVAEGAYPAAEHSLKMADAEFESFMKRLP
jgi:3-methyl-2-oxobutanoate hydroxymethyltransferase